jgi:hypothetical protein
MRHPEPEALPEKTCDEPERGQLHRISRTADRRNTIIRVNHAARNAMAAFDGCPDPSSEKQSIIVIVLSELPEQ